MNSLSMITPLGIFPERKSFVSYSLNIVLYITVPYDYHLYVKKIYLKKKHCSISGLCLYISFNGILMDELLQLLSYST